MGTLAPLTRNAACNAVVDLVDRGTPPGYLNFLGGSSTIIAHMHFATPAAFGAASSGYAVLTVGTTVQDTNAAAPGNPDTVSTAGIYSAAGTAVITAITCGTTGAEINLSSLSIATGDTVTLSSMQITMPATTTT